MISTNYKYTNMKLLKNPILLLVVFSTFFFSACEKDCKDENVISQNNLPVTGEQEVPEKVTKASGKLDVSYNKKTKILTYKITWSGLSGIPVGSHIHGEAPRGENAGIKHDFTALLPKTTSGTFSNSVLVDEVAIREEGLLDGLYYVNIHTPANPGGEIRGQIEFK
jgi:hypothetical protein